MNFEKLITSILTTNTQLVNNSLKAINLHITLRNWLIGFYIVEFEQGGDDRAKYGSKLLFHLANELKSKNLKKVNERELRNFRTFYKTYSYFASYLGSLSVYSLIVSKLGYMSIRGSATPELENQILGSVSQESETVIRQSVTPELQRTNYHESGEYFYHVFYKISYTHFAELIKIKDDTKRKFYELLVIKNTLSVRELEKQIAALTYERVGLSQNTELAIKELEKKLSPANPSDAIKSVYFFDFLDLPDPDGTPKQGHTCLVYCKRAK